MDRLLDDSLQCSADIIDSDCLEINGKDKFDSWYKGLRAVYSYMCHPMTNNGTREFALHSEYTECFSKRGLCLIYRMQLFTTNKNETTSLCNRDSARSYIKTVKITRSCEFLFNKILLNNINVLQFYVMFLLCFQIRICFVYIYIYIIRRIQPILQCFVFVCNHCYNFN